jgi:hypothetical protein
MPLLRDLKEILSDKPGSFILLSGYAAGFAPQSFAQAVESVFSPRTDLGEKGEIEINGTFGHLNIEETGSNRVLPTGIYVRFEA